MTIQPEVGIPEPEKLLLLCSITSPGMMPHRRICNNSRSGLAPRFDMVCSRCELLISTRSTTYAWASYGLRPAHACSIKVSQPKTPTRHVLRHRVQAERSFLLPVTMVSVSQPLPDLDLVNIHQRYTACQEPSDSGSAGVKAGLSKPAPYRALPACSAEFIDFDRQVSRQATYSSKNFPFGGLPLSHVAVELGHVPI